MSSLVLPGLLLATALAAANPPPATGLLDVVECRASPTQRYTLYVPGSYSPARRWPLLLCFDPGARGRLPVERFQAVAERRGYLVAGSLNSRNGPWPDNIAAAAAMLADIQARYAIEPARIYTAGMSGGARFATAIALSGTARGVIACAAGFPTAPDAIPGKIGFQWYGLAGSEDFNLAELREVDRVLEQQHAVRRLVEFEGPHDWPPAEHLAEAVDWLELQAMRTGTQPRDEAFIAEQLSRRQAALPTAPLERWRELRSLTTDFEGLADVSAFTAAANELGTGRAVRDARAAERALFVREEQLARRMRDAAVPGGRSRQQSIARELRAQSEAAEDTPERRLARRVIAGYVSMALESERDLIRDREFARAVARLQMCADLKPGQPRLWVELGRVQALGGETPQATSSLRQAIEAGWKDTAQLDADPAFAALRALPEFAQLRQAVARNATQK